jgi:hypothetical protein
MGGCYPNSQLYAPIACPGVRHSLGCGWRAYPFILSLFIIYRLLESVTAIIYHVVNIHSTIKLLAFSIYSASVVPNNELA